MKQVATPCDELIRLRAQCESQAKHEALYSRRDANWIVRRAPHATAACHRHVPPSKRH